MELGDRIKDLREKRDWNQTMLAKKIGISKSVMSRIEAGIRPLEDSLLVKIADVLDVTTDRLLGRERKDESNVEETEMNDERKRIANIIVNIKDPEKKKQAIAYLEYLANSPTNGAKK